MSRQSSGIPQVPRSVDPELYRFLTAIKHQAEVSQGVRGTGGTVSIDMLLRAGIINQEQASKLRLL
jgi:hypothetical protein